MGVEWRTTAKDRRSWRRLMENAERKVRTENMKKKTTVTTQGCQEDNNEKHHEKENIRT